MAKAPAGTPSRRHHPAETRTAARAPAAVDVPAPRALIPPDAASIDVDVGGRPVRLTNLRKPFWRTLGLTKGDLLRYYVAVAPVLLPHLRDRAMVMRRYPDGADGTSFFMKRAPSPRPAWIDICSIAHGSGNVIDFPMIQDLASLLWVVNLGCIDLNQWYATCDDVDRPDVLHFDLDPGPQASFAQVLETAEVVHAATTTLGMPAYAKTTGSKGMHIYVPIGRGPLQHEVWEVAKALAFELARRHPDLITAEYALAKRPKNRVLVDYNQNAWGRTLASVYSVRPSPRAGVSTPVTWAEVKKGVAIDDFRLDNVPARIRRRGDLWEPVLTSAERFDLAALL